MALESVSGVSPIDRYRAVASTSRPPESTPDAREAARQENDARRTAEAVRGASPAYLAGPDAPAPAPTVGTRVNVVPVAGDVLGTLQEAGVQVSRAYSSTEPTAADMRAASEAYRVESVARDELARQQQADGARSLDVLV